MPGKIPKIPIFDELLGTEKRIQQLQQKIAELDWLEYSFGLAKRVIITCNEEEEQAPVVYTGVTSDLIKPINICRATLVLIVISATGQNPVQFILDKRCTFIA